MRLSKLNIGQEAFIVKVDGDESFRRRINEMGFIPGTKITVIKRAPMNDPIEYELMGYRISLREREAAMIEISSNNDCQHEGDAFRGTVASSEYISNTEVDSTKKIRVALVGNPNCGKTTLFNFITNSNERVGNYSGVTVDMKAASLEHKGYKIELIDLPGTYSLSVYSPEEIYVRDFLMNQTPDIVVNVVDSSNLERNLFLTTQLIDMNLKAVVSLNMYDELLSKGDVFDYQMLGKMIGTPFIPTTASKREGIEELLDQVIALYNNQSPYYRHCHINYGDQINGALDRIKDKIRECNQLKQKHHNQYLAVKLLEGDVYVTQMAKSSCCDHAIISTTEKEIAELTRSSKQSSDAAIASARYSFIRGALKETLSTKDSIPTKGYAPDKLLTHKWLGLPLLLVILAVIFQATFTIGDYPMQWIEALVGWLSEMVSNNMPAGILHDMLVDGIIAGVGGVIIFLPNIALLFAFISILEDSGYMARVAFILDRFMHKIGLHGKSTIPMLMGFGCNVPAVLATKILENRKDRLVTMLIVPFMSCNARLPIYIMLTSIFFVEYEGLVLLSLYLMGIFIAIISAFGLNKFLKSDTEAPFVMELPPYRKPGLRNTLKFTWDKSSQYLKKMGGIILAASIAIWALGYFPLQKSSDANLIYEPSPIEDSYIASMGRAITPIIEPLDYQWREGVALITGVAAKEVVVSTMAVLYNDNGNSEEVEASSLSGMTKISAYSFMVFVLLYFPCMAVVAAIKSEAGWRWAIFTMLYTTSMAWLVAYIVTQVGKLIL